MVKIGKNEVPYSTSVALYPGESVSISPGALPGTHIRIDAVQKAIDPADANGGVEVDGTGSELVVSVPFLTGGISHSVNLRDFFRSPAGNVTVRLVRSSIGIAMLVHIDLIFESNTPR